ncbi:MAG: dihydroxyacetone kinase [Pseudonocardiales bacterium]|nr:MAG: dihydroxyacetone kinase [Pseudonocardiales bacterium]
MLQSLDGAAVRRWAVTCCDTLAAHRDEIDALNVFPVADQDTGSNLLATMRAGLDAVLRNHNADGGVPPGSTVAVLARGALMGARGNSGVILSQVLRGLAEPLIGPELDGRVWDGAALRKGLCRADELATAAVSEPVPGTVLTVLHAAARAAAAVRSDELGAVASAATAAAVGALADTPRQLAALAVAGVVDAGGRGLTLLLEALLAVVNERPGVRFPGVRSTVAAGIQSRPEQGLELARESGCAEYEYEVMYLLDGTDQANIATLRAELVSLGDCVAVVGSGETGIGEGAQLWNVHVHSSDVGPVIEAGVRAGRPHRITVLRFADQSRTSADHTDQAAARNRFVTDHAVLAMVSGSGVAELFSREGVATAPAHSSLEELRTVLAGTRARHVTVLAEPTAANRAELAAIQIRGSGQEVVVVPTGSPVQALAAIAVHDSARRPADDLVAMTEAAAATRRGELTVAREEALTWAGRCQPGDTLGMVGDEVVLIDRDSLVAARELVERMLSMGGELVTVLLGQDAPDGVGDSLIEHLRRAHPEVDVVVYAGRVPQRVLLVGVE